MTFRIGTWAMVTLVIVSATFALAGAPKPLAPAQSTIELQPCFSDENDCRSRDVWSPDGRVLVQVFPFYAGTVDVYLLGLNPEPHHLYSCHAPMGAKSCSRTVETGHPGTYAIDIIFDTQTRGALLLEVLTPS